MDLATGVALATGVFLRLVFYFSGWCLAFCPDMYVGWLFGWFSCLAYVYLDVRVQPYRNGAVPTAISGALCRTLTSSASCCF